MATCNHPSSGTWSNGTVRVKCTFDGLNPPRHTHPWAPGGSLGMGDRVGVLGSPSGSQPEGDPWILFRLVALVVLMPGYHPRPMWPLRFPWVCSTCHLTGVSERHLAEMWLISTGHSILFEGTAASNHLAPSWCGVMLTRRAGMSRLIQSS